VLLDKFNMVKLTVFIALLGYALAAPHCPSDYTRFEKRCYKAAFTADGFDWDQAAEACKAENARLASIHSIAEQDFVYGLQSETIKAHESAFSTFPKKEFWFGLIDANKNDTWSWTDGDILDYTNWHENEPDNGRTTGGKPENCGVFTANEGWQDYPCDSKFNGYICKRHRAPTCNSSLPRLIAPRSINERYDDTMEMGQAWTNEIDHITRKNASCNNKRGDAAKLSFNLNEAGDVTDEAMLAKCYKDPKICSITLTCNEDGRWTTEAANGKVVIVESMFCD